MINFWLACFRTAKLKSTKYMTASIWNHILIDCTEHKSLNVLKKTSSIALAGDFSDLPSYSDSNLSHMVIISYVEGKSFSQHSGFFHKICQLHDKQKWRAQNFYFSKLLKILSSVTCLLIKQFLSGEKPFSFVGCTKTCETFCVFFDFNNSKSINYMNL